MMPISTCAQGLRLATYRWVYHWCVGGRSNIQIAHFIYLFKGLILQTFKTPAPRISSKERRELNVRKWF